MNMNSSFDFCGICFETYNSNNITITQCGHKFHFSCLQLYKSNKCPICNFILFENNNNMVLPRERLCRTTFRPNRKDYDRGQRKKLEERDEEIMREIRERMLMEEEDYRDNPLKSHPNCVIM